MNELKINAKRLSPDEQHLIRKNIVRFLQKGMKPMEIAEALDVSRSHVYAVKKSWDEKGIAGISKKRRGRAIGEKRKLTLVQEREIQKLLVDKYPEQLKLPGCMWTRANVKDLIKRLYGIDLIPSTLGYYLSRWGFSVQRPKKQALKQDPEKIENWLETEFPGIKARAKAEGAEIFFGDETGVQNTANYARGYAPKGKTPVVRVDSKKMRVNMLSAISNRGKLRFILYRGSMNSDKLIEFMRRLVKDALKGAFDNVDKGAGRKKRKALKRKVFLILDNLSAHRSKKVTAWLLKHKEKIEVFYLPPYAPEYNPDELLNADLKRSVGNRSMVRSEKELEHNVRSHMKILQLAPEKIQSFFNAPLTKYAA